MKLHANARLSVKGRELLVDRVERLGWSLTEAAGVSDRTACKWLSRYRVEGPAGLLDRSSAPAVVANRTDERRVEVIAALHRLRFTGAEIAELLGMALSTVSGILRRIGLGKLGRLGLEPAQRYERERPGGLIHIDVKKLGRIQGGVGKRVAGHKRYTGQRTDAEGRVRNVIGWEYVHVAIDDATRLAYGGWAYGAIHRDSPERKAALAGWSDIYNRRRPQGALRPPLARLNKLNNLLGNYS